MNSALSRLPGQLCEQPLDEAASVTEPLTLSNARIDQIWELSLEEALRTALENGKVLRNLGGRFQSFGGPRPQTGEAAVSLLTAPTQTPTIYDPAIAETDGFSNTTLYVNNNSPIRQNGVPSTFTTNYDFTLSQPLLQGAGVTYNRIAGPDSFDNIYGRPLFRGVLLARINADISLAEFEAGVRNLVSDTEQSYWELYFAYRNLESRKAGRDSSLEASR